MFSAIRIHIGEGSRNLNKLLAGKRNAEVWTQNEAACQMENPPTGLNSAIRRVIYLEFIEVAGEDYFFGTDTVMLRYRMIPWGCTAQE